MPLLVLLEGPGRLVVILSSPVVAGEQTVQFRRPLEVGVHQERGIGVVDNVFLEIEVVFQNVVDHPAQEGDIRSGTERGVEIRFCGGLGKAGVNTDQLCALFPGPH